MYNKRFAGVEGRSEPNISLSLEFCTVADKTYRDLTGVKHGAWVEYYKYS